MLNPPDLRPMLAEKGVPRSLEGWAAEPKLDGWRARVLSGAELRLRTRAGTDIAASVPSIRQLAGRQVVLDGELVARAGTMADFYDVGASLARRRSVTFVAFDVLWLEGELLTSRPQQQRRRILEELELPVPVIPTFSYDDAPALFQACVQLGVEGVILKHLAAPYRVGQRSCAWRKVKVPAWRSHLHRRPRF